MAYFSTRALTKNQSYVLLFYKFYAKVCACLDKSNSTYLTTQEVSMRPIRSDLDRISSEVKDPDEQEKLRKFLLIREEIESNPEKLRKQKRTDHASARIMSPN